MQNQWLNQHVAEKSDLQYLLDGKRVS
jgi:hypothetical protein